MIDTEDVVRLVAQGLSDERIARELHVTSRTVQRHKRLAGLTHASPRVTSEMVARAGELLAGGAPPIEAARTIGVCKHTVRRYFPEHKWTSAEGAAYTAMIRTANTLLEGRAA